MSTAIEVQMRYSEAMKRLEPTMQKMVEYVRLISLRAVTSRIVLKPRTGDMAAMVDDLVRNGGMREPLMVLDSLKHSAYERRAKANRPS